MKKLILAALAVLSITSVASEAFAGGFHRTNGYYRSNGTWVNPYIAGNPDGNPYNNCSYVGC